jgi:rubredoxin
MKQCRPASSTVLASALPAHIRHPFPGDPMSQPVTYICIVCGFVYNEAEGRPEEGIAPGTKWADVPKSWACPDCGVAKADFEMVAI